MFRLIAVRIQFILCLARRGSEPKCRDNRAISSFALIALGPCTLCSRLISCSEVTKNSVAVCHVYFLSKVEFWKSCLAIKFRKKSGIFQNLEHTKKFGSLFSLQITQKKEKRKTTFCSHAQILLLISK